VTTFLAFLNPAENFFKAVQSIRNFWFSVVALPTDG
jgi:hypothetical protein